MALQTRYLFLKLSACSGGTARESLAERRYGEKGSRAAIRVLGDELDGIQLRARCGVTGIERRASPLQYQKQLRLQSRNSADRQLVTECLHGQRDQRHFGNTVGGFGIGYLDNPDAQGRRLE